MAAISPVTELFRGGVDGLARNEPGLAYDAGVITRSTVPTWDFTECQRRLENFRPEIGGYAWLWPILRLRARRTSSAFPFRLFSALTRFSRKRYVIAKTADSTRFLGDLRDRYSTMCAVQTTHDQWLIDLLNELVDRHPGSVLDVGANQGAIAAGIGRHIGAARKMFAFEPIPETAARAAATLALNGISTATVLPIAIGARNEAVSFHFPAGHSDIATARTPSGEPRDYQTLVVEMHTLDSLLGDVLQGRVGVIKIDVEGLELEVVGGAIELIRRDRPAILFEYWPEAAGPLGWRAQDIATLIMSAGGQYTFQAYLGDQRVAYPPPCDELCYNVVALPGSTTER